jgi:hypothetical protein
MYFLGRGKGFWGVDAGWHQPLAAHQERVDVRLLCNLRPVQRIQHTRT